MPQKRGQIEEQRPLLEGFEMPSGASRRNFICCVISILICVGLFVYVNIELFKWNKAKGGDAWHQVLVPSHNIYIMMIKYGINSVYCHAVDQLNFSIDSQT
jgi:hypothetical protein